MNEKTPIPSSSFAAGRRLAGLSASLKRISIRGRVVVWLLMFISAYRLGMPILFSAALSGLPWLMLPGKAGEEPLSDPPEPSAG
ncbi:hypothetical protein [Telmatospirillum siberiense]|uniref:Uncharacterized protein n=1 Tax=Telmatospirillum siberiense TaxID=382514 RepID=A0A2N3PSQ5_9PROT|nr:hypothetical protein [Telmatospirillum siberiense]PKU23437.1 hypothetical protein CWS72_16390 [Telmatospirillum siberiense]